MTIVFCLFCFVSVLFKIYSGLIQNSITFACVIRRKRFWYHFGYDINDELNMSQSVTLRHTSHFRHDFDLTLRSKWYANTSKVEEKKTTKQVIDFQLTIAIINKNQSNTLSKKLKAETILMQPSRKEWKKRNVFLLRSRCCRELWPPKEPFIGVIVSFTALGYDESSKVANGGRNLLLYLIKHSRASSS